MCDWSEKREGVGKQLQEKAVDKLCRTLTSIAMSMEKHGGDKTQSYFFKRSGWILGEKSSIDKQEETQEDAYDR